ncbi:hypothetical protein EUGRSUZ_I01327 [Eucalyptus grandis]|uniref:Uncharacterized protein n=2 Tax=Eucalyptus grandis TaxID=71139 RepID=A0ACC3JEC2_EUCGR|nr:hypothetical protein EUGRSUZ_I01327 [Eucalyptus grandis]
MPKETFSSDHIFETGPVGPIYEADRTQLIIKSTWDIKSKESIETSKSEDKIVEHTHDRLASFSFFFFPCQQVNF